MLSRTGAMTALKITPVAASPAITIATVTNRLDASWPNHLLRR
jgi:hypothetical protein